MRGLYAIVDVQALGARQLDVERFAEALLETPIAAMQLRDKRLDSRDTLRLLASLAKRCRQAGVPLFGNDRADLAALAGCDGVHVGQRDLPAATARRVLQAVSGGGKVGVSVHNHAELASSVGEQPDYLAFGPVFGTASKKRPDPTIGLDGLAALVGAAPKLPFVAIGGIDRSNASAVAQHCACGAVIAALLPKHDDYREVAERAAELHQLLSGS